MLCQNQGKPKEELAVYSEALGPPSRLFSFQAFPPSPCAPPQVGDTVSDPRHTPTVSPGFPRPRSPLAGPRSRAARAAPLTGTTAPSLSAVPPAHASGHLLGVPRPLSDVVFLELQVFVCKHIWDKHCPPLTCLPLTPDTVAGPCPMDKQNPEQGREAGP